MAAAGPKQLIYLFFNIMPSSLPQVGSWELVPGADHALGSIHNIKEALPELWEGEEDENDQPEQAMQAPVVETMVLV